MAHKEQKFYYQRRWLNTKDGRGYTIADVVYAYKYVEANLEIGDCSRTIFLDFGFDPDKNKEYNKQLKKLDKLIETCQKMREGMVQAKEGYIPEEEAK